MELNTGQIEVSFFVPYAGEFRYKEDTYKPYVSQHQLRLFPSIPD